MLRIIYYNKDRRVFTRFHVSMGENSCPPYCGYRFNYLRK